MKILIIEDEHRIASAIKKGLEQERYTVDVAYDGLEGYDLASTGTYDTIILDLMLPSIDGLEVCQKLRKESINTPILMLTAKSEIKDKVTGLNTGADDYLTKPFSFEELLARIKALTRRPSKAAPSIIKVGDLELDTINYVVKRQGNVITISQKEYALLEFMMKNAGHTLSKSKLIDHVWDYNADILPNTIEVYIRKLRTLIDTPYPNLPSHIKTLRGFGYKLE